MRGHLDDPDYAKTQSSKVVEQAQFTIGVKETMPGTSVVAQTATPVQVEPFKNGENSAGSQTPALGRRIRGNS